MNILDIIGQKGKDRIEQYRKAQSEGTFVSPIAQMHEQDRNDLIARVRNGEFAPHITEKDIVE